MANEITLTSGEQYRPAMLFWRTDRRLHSAPTSPRLPTSTTQCGRGTRIINGAAGPGQDGAPAMIQCQP